MAKISTIEYINLDDEPAQAWSAFRDAHIQMCAQARAPVSLRADMAAHIPECEVDRAAVARRNPDSDVTFFLTMDGGLKLRLSRMIDAPDADYDIRRFEVRR